jgi:hypothetical protein
MDKLKTTSEVKECEACKIFAPQWELTDYPPGNYFNGCKKPYKVCSNCLSNLVNLSLSPKQFNNLIQSGHGLNEHLLHEDFYDSGTGVALQPR